MTGTRFGELHGAMQLLVDTDLLAGFSMAVLRNGELADLHCAGRADREAGIALRPDHIFGVFSQTKLATSCAALQLKEEGASGRHSWRTARAGGCATGIHRKAHDDRVAAPGSAAAAE